MQAAAAVSLVTLGICAFVFIATSNSSDSDDSVLNILTAEVSVLVPKSIRNKYLIHFLRSRIVLRLPVQLHGKRV